MIFPDIETYIEFIAGAKDINGKTTWSWKSTPVLQLANYDVGFIASVAEQIESGIALSDRQSALALKLIIKYERQLNKFGVEQPSALTPHRLGVRVVSREAVLTLHDDGTVRFKFPFNEALIKDIKEFAKTAQGKVDWNPVLKSWMFGCTEWNVNYAYALAKTYGIQIDVSVQELFNLIIESEKQPFKIELYITDDGKPEITNAPLSMVEYLNDRNAFNNLYSLVDNAGMMGYTISPEITDTLTLEHGNTFMRLCANRIIEMDKALEHVDIADVMRWAITVDRSPIFIFNPNFVNIKIEDYVGFFSVDEILIIDHKTREEDFPTMIDPQYKLVYTTKILPNLMQRIPVLITYANLMHGANKRGFMDLADKIVYACAPLPRR